MGRLRKEEADKKAKEAEEKRKRLEEAEKKRQAMMQAQKEKQQAAGQGAKGPKKTDSGMGNVQNQRAIGRGKENLLVHPHQAFGLGRHGWRTAQQQGYRTLGYHCTSRD